MKSRRLAVAFGSSIEERVALGLVLGNGERQRSPLDAKVDEFINVYKLPTEPGILTGYMNAYGYHREVGSAFHVD